MNPGLSTNKKLENLMKKWEKYIKNAEEWLLNYQIFLANIGHIGYYLLTIGKHWLLSLGQTMWLLWPMPTIALGAQGFRHRIVSSSTGIGHQV